MRWLLVFYDSLVCLAIGLSFLVIYPSHVDQLTVRDVIALVGLQYLLVFFSRYLFSVYRQIWRYGDMRAYLRLIIADGLSGVVFVAARFIPLFAHITFPRAVSMCAINLLAALAMRITYQYMYQSKFGTPVTRAMRWVFNTFCGTDFKDEPVNGKRKRIGTAIIGAGEVGVQLAELLNASEQGILRPVCYVDKSGMKAGRTVQGLPVLDESSSTLEARIHALGVQEAVIAVRQIGPTEKKRLYDLYSGMGLRVRVYDYPTLNDANTKRQLREFDIEELLFRAPKDFLTEEVRAYYRGRSILITGGGGSIGGEMARQIARMEPRQLILFDVYENGAYDVQQELRYRYRDRLDLRVEISTMTDPQQLDQIFGYYKPDIVIHAAAHKHVPVMERNVIEAVKNNVFGTQNVLEACRKHGVKRFMMVSTDKAVNPTNVMGATKRMCERMVLNYPGDMVVSATRFGNVLGSAGSVVPLFKRQILNGGPVTVTDKRIVRYFMTIPEASQLVLASGQMAKSGQLFVLDMGKPVKILELAENMIRLSGLEPYKDIDIVETGLREGEKLYEELLVRGDSLTKTANRLIYIEEEPGEDYAVILSDLRVLSQAVDTMNARVTRDALHRVIPTFRTPEEVNTRAEAAKEMQLANGK